MKIVKEIATKNKYKNFKLKEKIIVKHLIKSDTIFESKQLQLLSKSKAFEVVNILQYLCFFRRGRIFWSTFLHHIYTEENGIQFLCVGWCPNAYFVVNDGRILNSIDSLEHRWNFACVLIFYRYYRGFCSSEIKQIIPVNMYSYVTLVFLGKDIGM